MSTEELGYSKMDDATRAEFEEWLKRATAPAPKRSQLELEIRVIGLAFVCADLDAKMGGYEVLGLSETAETARKRSARARQRMFEAMRELVALAKREAQEQS